MTVNRMTYLQRVINPWIFPRRLQSGCAVPAGSHDALHRATDGGIDKLFVQTWSLWTSKCLGTRSFLWNWDIGRYSWKSHPKAGKREWCSRMSGYNWKCPRGRRSCANFSGVVIIKGSNNQTTVTNHWSSENMDRKETPLECSGKYAFMKLKHSGTIKWMQVVDKTLSSDRMITPKAIKILNKARF